MLQMEHVLEQREYEAEQLRKRLEMEKQLLERLNVGLMDGVIRNSITDHEFTHLIFIKNGRPMLAKYLTEKGPIPEATIIEKEFETDEGKLWFMRNYGWKMEDVYACLYSYLYKRTGGL